MTRVRRLEHELDDLTGVEIAADEFGIGFVFFERHDGEMSVCHDGVADGGDAFEEVKGMGGGGAGWIIGSKSALVI